MIKPISNEDIMVWPDGTWCFRHQLPEMSHKSDDYVVFPEGTPEADAILADDFERSQETDR